MPVISNFPCGSGRGGGIALDPVSIGNITVASEKVYISWTDPEDLILDGIPIAEWDGTLLVRKAGSEPQSRRDGVLVLDSKERNAYQDEYFCDSGLSNDVTYYYKFFPYTKTKTYTDSEANAFDATPYAMPIGDVSDPNAENAGNGKLSITWQDPDDIIVNDGKDGIPLAIWEKTIVVVKKGIAADSPDDPDAVYTYTSTTRNAHCENGLLVTGLENGWSGAVYYVSFFPVSTNGAVTNDTNYVTCSCNRFVIDQSPLQSGSLTYNGTVQTPAWQNYDTAKMTLSGEASALDAGTYSAVFVPTEDYCWGHIYVDASNISDDIEPKTVTWSIGKAGYTLTVNPASLTLDLTNKSATLAITRKGNGIITAVSGNSSVAVIGRINQNTGEITVNSVNSTRGIAKITVKVEEGDNYLASNEEIVTVTASFPEYLYGFDINLADSNPATRVSYPSDVDNAGFAAACMDFDADQFSYGGWPATPGEKFMPRPCMLMFAGTVGYYLDPNDYTRKADGSASDVANIDYGGNAMMEWPKIFTKRWESDGVYHFRCSDMKIDDDYECWCNYDKNNHEIPHFYTPIYFGSKDSSNRLRSISGQANMVSQTAQFEVSYAKNNGADIWYTEVAADRFLIQDLLVMMCKNTNLKKTAGIGRYYTDTDANPEDIVPGTMNTKGLFWGSNDKRFGVKVFGMENFWGNLFRRTAGLILSDYTYKVKITRGTKDGSTSSDYNFDGSGYKSIEGVVPKQSGYISKMKTEPFGRFPFEFVGSGATFESVYIVTGDGSSNYASAGGSWNYGMSTGLFGVDLYYRAGSTRRDIGAALSCKPLA